MVKRAEPGQCATLHTLEVEGVKSGALPQLRRQPCRHPAASDVEGVKGGALPQPCALSQEPQPASLVLWNETNEPLVDGRARGMARSDPHATDHSRGVGPSVVLHVELNDIVPEPEP